MPLWWVLVRHGVGHVVDGVDDAVVRAEREGAAALDGEFVAAQRGRVPWWSRYGRQLLANLLDGPIRAARTELGIELTRQVLELGERRARGEPPPGPATAPSAVPGVEWLHETDGDRVVVRPSREVPASGPRPLPLRAELRWPHPRAAG
jgi:hypothetical protein